MKRQPTLNPNPPVRVKGHVDIPPSGMVTLKAKDRLDYAKGRPMIFNKRRYIIISREPPEFQSPGAEAFLTLRLDNSSTRKQRRSAARAARHGG